MKPNLLKVFSVLLMLWSIAVLTAPAQIPRTVAYQGVLSDTLGNPKPDGAYLLTFRLYEASGGGSPIWTEVKSIDVKQGLFMTNLGDHDPFGTGVKFDKPYWLSLQVGAESELLPRVALNAAAYSLISQTSDSARIAGTIPDNAVTSAKIANGTISLSDIGQNGASTGQTIKWTGSAWGLGTDNGGPWTTAGSNIYYNAGKVGIGTSSPLEGIHVVGNAQFDKAGAAPGQLVLRTPSRNDPGRYGIRFSNNLLGTFLGDDSTNQYFGFYSAWSNIRAYDAIIEIHGKSTSSWGNVLQLTHDGTDGHINTDKGNLILTPVGNVGIKVANPTYALTLPNNANATGQGLANAWQTYSSRRWKTNIKTLEGAIEKVGRLRGVSYDWMADGKHDVGLIAEEVGAVIPEVVSFEGNGQDARSLDYSRLVAVLIEAIKEQQKQIESLNAIVRSLAAERATSGSRSLGEIR